ncbi:MAG: MFS transporter [Pseudomonadota bacterium]
MTFLRIILLWVAGLCAAAQFAKVSVFFPLLEALYPDVGASAGFLVSIISFMGVVVGLTAGPLSAHIGMRRLIVWALVLGGALSFVQMLFPPFQLMLGLRVLEGLSHLAIVVVAPTLILQVTPEGWRGAAMTLWGTFFGVAFAATALVGSPIIEAYGLQGLFAAHGVFMLVTGLALSVALKGLFPVQAADDVPGLVSLMRQHVCVYASPRVAAPALGWLFYTFTFVAALTVLPSFIDPQWRLFAVAVMPIASILVSLSLGVIALRYMSAVSLILVGFVLSIGVASLIALQGASAFLAIALLGTLGLVQGSSFAAIGELVEAPADRANASGAMAQMGNLGNLLGTPVFLAAASWNGLSGITAAMVIAYMAGIAMHLWSAQRRCG